MNVHVDLHSPVEKYYEEQLLAEIAQETIQKSGVISRDDIDITISVAIVDEIEMQRVNNEFRNKNIVTDVISIGDYSDNIDISSVNKSKIFLGEVILCYNFIEQFARENNVKIDKEFFTIYSHGVLHLLGLQHGDEMFTLQDAVSEKFCYNK
ncbi:MAG: rRNA maturation RNase YbeY [Patescibacteria group bacterium]|nr:rRNA maturation RNase YbeY [Patescibacteria group bacterium]